MPDLPAITPDLVARLIAAEFPSWARLPIHTVEADGWDNRSFRLGEDLVVRLPSAPAYAPQAEKEAVWLPRLAPLLPLPIPEVVALVRPSDAFPLPWSVRRWLTGRPLLGAADVDQPSLAVALAGFLRALRAVPPEPDAPAGEHSFHRGSPLAHYDRETRDAAARLEVGRRQRALSIWAVALAASPSAELRRWFHGDVAAGNLLLKAGRLSAVLDFGVCGVGDPACDLAFAWTDLSPAARERFRSDLGVDDAEWARGSGWALWKALVTLDEPARAWGARHTLAELGV